MPKTLVKTGSSVPKTRSRQEVSTHLSGREIIRRELRRSLKFAIFGIYSLIMFVAGGYYLHQQSGPDLVQQKVELEKLQHTLLALGDKLKQSSHPDRWIRENNKILQEEIVQTLQQREDAQVAIINRQKQEIASLKHMLERTVAPKRAPASVKKKTLTYSYENMSVLQYEHNLKVRRFEDEQAERLKAFIAVLDLSSTKDRKRLKLFKDKQKVELYAYEQKLSVIRSKFRKDKFIVLE
jgi:hypothetical protein